MGEVAAVHFWRHALASAEKLLSLAEFIILAIAIFKGQFIVELLLDFGSAIVHYLNGALVDLIHFELIHPGGRLDRALPGHPYIQIRVVRSARILLLSGLMGFVVDVVAIVGRVIPSLLCSHRIVLAPPRALWLVAGAGCWRTARLRR